MRASDVVVRRCLQPPDGLSGAGFEVSYGGIAELVRVLVSECLDAGIVAAIEGSSLTMTDVVVRDTTESTTTIAAGFGLLVMQDATARAERLAVERATQSAVTVAERARAELFDVSVRDTRASDVDGYGGWSLAAQMGGEIVAERIEASGARQASLVTYGGTLSLRDLRVTQTASADCERWSCPSGSHGYGVVALAQGRASLDRFVIDESSLCGSMVASVDVASLFTGPGEIDLTDGTISNAPVGACVQVDGYALERLSRNVLYLDNGVNLDATSYPPPAPAALPTL
ncbi:MAG: hypothetical protein IT379_11605 [Deltaproteobacteria bacterium]|nr:hypothetical protein [Deltaproteobacteria bacterium]